MSTEKHDEQDVWYLVDGQVKKAKKYTQVVKQQVVCAEDGTTVWRHPVYTTEQSALVASREYLQQSIKWLQDDINVQEIALKDSKVALEYYQKQLEENYQKRLEELENRYV